jgi:hypothetical protein
MRRADVDPGVEETRTVDLPDITKSVQEPILAENEPALIENNPQTSVRTHRV